MTTAMAMFPLESVLFPSAVLPLHVFEPRYRALTRHCLAGDGCFGVTLIERGSEVGGGDIRGWWGTRARIAEAQELPDGRWVVVAVGVNRIRVTRWLPDEPFPRAESEDVVEPSPGPKAAAARSRAEQLLRRALALKSELGEPAPPATTDLSPDHGEASFQIAALAPVGPADAYRVLQSPGPDQRLDLLSDLLSEELAVLRARAAGG